MAGDQDTPIAELHAERAELKDAYEASPDKAAILARIKAIDDECHRRDVPETP